ncbi:MAG: isoleucine--tRNA ligase [Candidatus Aenigmarchaeota archaeon]|nr:isoleucine--tRNA ligase [Candidatus Aenigmarchaeota archaeon]
MNSPQESEEQILDFWKKKKIYEKAVEKRKNAKKFYFLDGPPYATGYIHMGTAMNKILKDFYIRFFRMYGFKAWNQPGYDTHGVPIENKVEQKLGFKEKQDIEKFGIDKFIEECRNYTTQFLDVMNNQFANLGVWMDWKHPYLTLSNEYIEGAWFTFKQGYEKGLLYKGTYSVHVCPHCETAVAYNEIEYTQVTDPSIFVKFKLKKKQNEYFVIWTTTPWTLASNTGIMVKPDAEYARVQVGDEIFIIAKQLLDSVMTKVKIKDFTILETMKGKELKDLEYESPLRDIFPFIKKLKNAHRIVLSDKYVTLEDGSGLVHTAPGHGQEDYKVGVENDLPIVNPLGFDGKYNKESGKYSGMFVKTADKLIIEDLRNLGALLSEEKVEHDYPLCWRCSSPLLMMAVPQWFFKVTEIRERLLSENKKINWVPAWAGQRFQNWLESLGDWPISRQRYWGIPLPIWICKKCNEVKVIGSTKELPKIPKDLHKPYIDEIVFKCKVCRDEMRRVPDVLDVWFDAGVASWASLGYPSDKKLFDKMWPADFILEGPDQIRGWWNSLMITSIMTFGIKPFLNVLFHGFVLDAHGIKMSKSKGNTVEPEEVIKKYGRDVLRFYFLLGAPWDDYFFKWEDIADISKSFVVIRNVFNFVSTYVSGSGSPKNLRIEDKWILSKLNTLVRNTTEYNKTFQGHKSAKELKEFILNDFSRWYVKLIRDRVWPTYSGKDKKAAFFTLVKVTETLIRLLAPFTPFMSEEIYQSVLKKTLKVESVHLLDWPVPDKKMINQKLEEDMEVVKKIVEACQTVRQTAGIKLRWPIKEVLVQTSNKKMKEAVKNLKSVLMTMCNSKDVRTSVARGDEYIEAPMDFGKVFIQKQLDSKLMQEALYRELSREIQSLRKKHGFIIKQSIKLTLKSDDMTNKLLKTFIINLKKEVGAKEVLIGKLKGKHKGSLDFGDSKIEIQFS